MMNNVNLTQHFGWQNTRKWRLNMDMDISGGWWWIFHCWTWTERNDPFNISYKKKQKCDYISVYSSMIIIVYQLSNIKCSHVYWTDLFSYWLIDWIVRWPVVSQQEDNLISLKNFFFGLIFIFNHFNSWPIND